jgi:hypothetical protein
MAKNHSSPRGLKTIALMAATPASRMPERLSVMELDMWATLWIACLGAIALLADSDRPELRFALIPEVDRTAAIGR